eukprot:2627450-Pleurochrysis_carterae.AAC.1
MPNFLLLEVADCIDRPVGLALYGRYNRKSVGSPGAVPLRSAPRERHRQYSNDYGIFTMF